MRLILILTLSLFSISPVFSQSDSVKVGQNKNKIGELNERLDKILESSKTIDGDSVQYKLDLLFNEIKEIKSSLTELKDSVGGLSEKVKNVKSIESAESKIADMESGKYYLVLASRRDKNRINQAKMKLANRDLLMVQNKKGTWYHLVLNQSMSMKEAIMQTATERTNGVKDAWWVTAKKLQLN